MWLLLALTLEDIAKGMIRDLDMRKLVKKDVDLPRDESPPSDFLPETEPRVPGVTAERFFWRPLVLAIESKGTSCQQWLE
jgi:hypothetical protein